MDVNKLMLCLALVLLVAWIAGALRGGDVAGWLPPLSQTQIAIEAVSPPLIAPDLAGLE